MLSKQPIEVIKKQVEGFWHGMMHVKTAGVDVIATHLSPFEWKYRLNEAQQIVDYIQANHLKDYYVAGDLNAHSHWMPMRLLNMIHCWQICNVGIYHKKIS